MSTYRRNATIEAMYCFFKRPKLRYYLIDFIGTTHVMTGAKRHFNPLVLYIMRKNTHNIVKNLEWWREHKSKAFSDDMFRSIASLWSSEHPDDQITIDDVFQMITSSYDEWSHEEENEHKLQHYIFFGMKDKLSTFFETFLPDVEGKKDNVSQENIKAYDENIPTVDSVQDDHEDQEEDHGNILIEHGDEYHNYECLDDDVYPVEQNDQDDFANSSTSAMEVQENASIPSVQDDHYEQECCEYLDDNDDSMKQFSHGKLFLNDFANSSTSAMEENEYEKYIANSKSNYKQNKKVAFQMDKAEIIKRLETSEPLVAKEDPIRNNRCNDQICFLCGYQCKENACLERHYRLYHNQFNCYRQACDGLSFPTNSEFLEHVQLAHGLFECNICRLFFKNLQLHQIKHSKDHQPLKRNSSKTKRQVAHKCSDQRCAETFSTAAERINHELIHWHNTPCRVCIHYLFTSMRDYIHHMERCNQLKKIQIENTFIDFANDSYVLYQSLSASSPNDGNHNTPVFSNSILFQKQNGAVIIDQSDKYPFWRKDLIVPFYGSFSFVASKMSTNQKRNDNIQNPSLVKTFMFGVYPLGDTALIQFNTLARQVEYSFQGFDLDLWEQFKVSDLKKARSKLPFLRNSNIEQFLQKYPALSGCDYDRGHLTPLYMACSENDQIEFQMQGNLFYQQSYQNRTVWKKLEMSVPAKMKAKKSRFAHITTGVVYERDIDGKFIYDSRNSKVIVVEYYFKVIFYEVDYGKVDVDCFLMCNKNKDEKIKEVTLYDLDNLKNNHLKFLNGILLKRLKDGLLDVHSKP